jgi:hypothetical protein
MSKSRASRILFAAFVVAMTACAAGAQGSVHNYRYELTGRSQEPAFAMELSSAVGVGGSRYEVEADAQGRTARIAVIRNGRKLSETVFRFAANAKLPSEFDKIEAGQKTGLVIIERDDAGNRVRENSFTVGGALLEYVEYSYQPDHVEQDFFTTAGKKSEHVVRYYSPKDSLTRRVAYTNPDDPGKRTEYEYDDGTGLAKSRQQFSDGKLNVTVTYTYNADADLVRSDAYDSNHNWFAADEFNDELRTKRSYKDGGGTREMRLTYDENRWLKETVLYYKNVLICRFSYDRFPNGTAKRTLVVGPDGKAWAEYPDYEVFDVKRNGEPWDGKLPGSVVHKTGNWW